MECNYRLRGLLTIQNPRLSILLRFSTMLSFLVLCSCAGFNQGNPPQETVVQQPVRILVNLEVETTATGGVHDPKVIREVQDKVIERLLAFKHLGSVRRYQRIPVIAVTVDAEILLQLLRMPEVRSIEPDREMQLFN